MNILLYRLFDLSRSTTTRFENINTVAAKATLYFTVAAEGRHAVERMRRRQVKYSVALWQRKKEHLLK